MKLSGPEEVVQPSSTAGILEHISTCCRQTCPTKTTVSKSFFFVLLGSKLRKQAHTLSINFSNLIPQSCGVH